MTDDEYNGRLNAFLGASRAVRLARAGASSGRWSGVAQAVQSAAVALVRAAPAAGGEHGALAALEAVRSSLAYQYADDEGGFAAAVAADAADSGVVAAESPMASLEVLQQRAEALRVKRERAGDAAPSAHAEPAAEPAAGVVASGEAGGQYEFVLTAVLGMEPESLLRRWAALPYRRFTSLLTVRAAEQASAVGATETAGMSCRSLYDLPWMFLPPAPNDGVRRLALAVTRILLV